MADDAADRARDHARDADRDLDEASRKLAFADEVEQVSRRLGKLPDLAREVARARTRGWVWGPEWDATHERLERTGPGALADVRSEVRAAADRLRGRVDATRSRLSRTSPSPATESALRQIADEASDVLDAVKEDERRILAVSQPFVQSFDQLDQEVREAHEHLDRFEAAKFQLGAGEHPWLTAEVAWQDAPSGPVGGLLYLTDKRIRYERKETVATKKFLFLTTASEEKHELLIDEPVGNIARSDDSTKGMIFKDQLVTITWTNSRLAKTTFDFNSGGTAKEWDLRLEELRSGQIGHRLAAGGIPSGTHGMPVNAPTVCSACSAALDAPVRGQTVLVCKYCGQRHDLQFA